MPEEATLNCVCRGHARGAALASADANAKRRSKAAHMAETAHVARPLGGGSLMVLNYEEGQRYLYDAHGDFNIVQQLSAFSAALSKERQGAKVPPALRRLCGAAVAASGGGGCRSLAHRWPPRGGGGPGVFRDLDSQCAFTSTVCQARPSRRALYRKRIRSRKSAGGRSEIVSARAPRAPKEMWGK